jgi:hypothetical protein
VVEHFFAISSLQKQKTKSPIPISEDHHRVLHRSGVSLSSPIATTACVGVTISSSHGLRIKLLPASCLRNEPPPLRIEALFGPKQPERKGRGRRSRILAMSLAPLRGVHAGMAMEESRAGASRRPRLWPTEKVMSRHKQRRTRCDR